MITPSFGLTATERVLPNFAVDFTTAILDPRITITRALNTATRTNSAGVIEIVNANLPRFDYNPSTLVCKGLLIEESRKNLFLNSLIDGTDLSTQIVTTTATATTISFYGTGGIVLSGTHSATVNGLGAYPTRTTYTFTPTAGALTATVSGTVQYAQIEAGAFATSFIPTDATVGGITRNADVATMTGTNFSDWYNQSEGSFAVTGSTFTTATTALLSVDDGTTQNRMTIRRAPSTLSSIGVTLNVTQWNNNTPANSWPSNTTKTATLGYKLNDIGFALGGADLKTDTVATIPTVTICRIGGEASGAAGIMSGYVQKISYWPQKLTNSEIVAFSK